MKPLERRLQPGALITPCLVLFLIGCGTGSGDGRSSERAGETPSEPLAIAAARPTDEPDPADPGTANPFEVPDPDAATPPDAPSGQIEPPVTPDSEPEDVVYCD